MLVYAFIFCQVVRVWHRYLQVFVSCDRWHYSEAWESRSRHFPVRNAFFFGRVVASAKRKPILPGHFPVIFLPLRALTLSVILVTWLSIGFQANPFILLLLRHWQLEWATRCYLSYFPKEKWVLLIIYDYCSLLTLTPLIHNRHNWLFQVFQF